jgi:hypothetical protein
MKIDEKIKINVLFKLIKIMNKNKNHCLSYFMLN